MAVQEHPTAVARTGEPQDPVAATGAALKPLVPRVTDELVQVLLDSVASLREGESSPSPLRASVEGNVTTLVQLMQHGIDVRVAEAPAGAVLYARRLAQRGVPFSELLRAYHLAHAYFFDVCLRQLVTHVTDAHSLADATARLSNLLLGYVDHVCQHISATYDQERENWLRQRDSVRVQRVQALLDGHPADEASTSDALGYHLGGGHLAVLLWYASEARSGDELRRLGSVVHAIAELTSCRGEPLVLPTDEASLTAWLPLPHWPMLRPAGLAHVMTMKGTHLRAALGAPARGMAGFVRTHQQATAARTVAVIGATAEPTTWYDDVASVALLCHDLPATRAWLAETLGGLCATDDQHARLRETLRAVLNNGGSHTAAAAHLHCHKNTVQYRIRRAEQARGRRLTDQRVDLELALDACHWLGNAVLPDPGASLG
jgi:PucR C-terminal helix-turn-helix domain/GGDEF-like domain